MTKALFFILLGGLILISCNNSDKTAIVSEEINVYNTNGLLWDSIENITKIDTVGSKKYLIDIYTEWCSWCKVMDKKTFSDAKVQQTLKDNFHLIKFNAETKDTVEFMGESYEWLTMGRKGANKLAVRFLEGKLSYPTLVYLDEDMETIRVSQGYKNSEELLQELEVITKS